MMLKKAFLVWLTRIKGAVAVLYLECTLLSIMLVKTHIDNPLQWIPTQNVMKKQKKNPQLNITDNILRSKYWVIKAVFHLADFRPWRFFCWSFKKRTIVTKLKQFSGENIHLKVWFFEVTLPRHRCLLGNFSFILGGCSWYSFAMVMMFTRCIDLYQ